LTILVTGANGFVGVNLVRRLAQNGATVIALARRPPDPETRRFLASEAERIVWIKGDVRDRAGLAALAQQYHIAGLVHNAAMTPSALVEHSQSATVVDVNLMGTVNALEAARQVQARRFVFVSSTGLYGAPANPHRLLSEDEPLRTTKLYTICKVASEQFCRRYNEVHNLSTVVGRLGSAYGPMERASKSRENMSIIYELAHHALAGEQLRVFGSDRLRDLCYVENIADAFARLVEADDLTWPIYNVATDTPVTTRDALDLLCQLCPGFGWLAVDQPHEADIAILPEHERAALDMSRLRRDVDYTPERNLLRGLQSYLNWLRSGWDQL
jgi:nucleoside-diphosphate-sugar epimerase